MSWIEELEKYFDDISTDLQTEVREFLEEYYEKKDTHSATSLEGLSDEELENLLYLELKDKNLKKLPLKIQKCRNLKILRIVAPITDFSLIKHLSKLRILDLFHVKIKQDNDFLKNYHNLVVLSIIGYCYFDFSKEINRLNKLLICYIEDFLSDPSTNQSLIQSFPEKISNAVYITINNQNIQKDFELKDFSNLNYLQIVGSNIKNIPISIGRCKKLKEIFIHSNQIDFLPEELFQLKQLSGLDFSHNKINSVSNEIFSLPNLKMVDFSYNPFSEAPNFKMVNDLIKDADIDDETPFFELIKSLSKPDTNPNYNYFTLKIPKTLQTPMLQYIEFFKDYVEGTKGKNIIFEVKRDDEGLILITNGNTGIELPELGEYFQEYVGLVQQDLDNWIPKFETPKTAMEADILRAKVERQVRSLRSDLDIARLENKYLSNEVADKAAQINFLQSLTQDLQQDIRTLINGNTAKPLNVNQLLFDIQDQAVKMLERKYSHQLEDLHNDVMTDFLRQKGYYVTDQTRSGRSKLQVGEIDIMIRKKDGTPFSIIEAFRLKSCGDDNKIVAQHLDKLLHDYDTAGHQSNFVIVYAEAKNFEPLWENYKTYVSKLNGKPDFRANYPLITFEEKEEYSNKSSIKIGVGSHRREGAVVDIYHVFINMFG